MAAQAQKAEKADEEADEAEDDATMLALRFLAGGSSGPVT